MNITKKLIAGAAGLAVALLPAAGAAWAEEPGDGAAAPAYGIDAKKPASLTIHKLTAPAGDTNSQGLPTDDLPAGAKPVAGVEFQLCSVPRDQINLLTNAGWKAAQEVIRKYQETRSTDGLTAGGKAITVDCGLPNNTLPTDTQGVAKFTSAANGLETGRLYFVKESNASGATVDGKPVNVSPAAPFFVTVPMTNQKERNSWLYDIHVYPKNGVVTLNKEVQDQDSLTVGSQLSYRVAADIPQRSGSEGVVKYVLGDPYDTQSLELVRESVRVSHCATKADSATCQQGNGTDFADSDYDVVTDASGLKIVFNAAGLKKLTELQTKNASAGAAAERVVLSFDAKILKLEKRDGQFIGINNLAYLIPDNEHGDVPPTLDNPTPEQPGGKLPPVTSNVVKSKFAQLKLHKVDEQGKNLAGAKFQLFRVADKASCEAGSLNPADRIFPAAPSEGSDDAAKKDGVASDSSGSVVFPAVRVSDFAGNQDITADNGAYWHYCVMEVEAPQGYELAPSALYIPVLANGVQDAVFSYGEDIVNVKHNAGFKLPMTGESARIALAIAAVALIVGGVIAARRRSARA